MKKMTPLDIQHKQFDKQFRGFNTEQVQSFLQDVVAYAEELHKSVMELTKETEDQKKRIEELELSEKEIKETMQTAQKMTEQITENANNEAKVITQQAEMQAEKIIRQAHDRLTEIINQINDMKKQKAEFYGQIKGIIETHQKLLDSQSTKEEMLVQIEDVGILPKVS